MPVACCWTSAKPRCAKVSLNQGVLNRFPRPSAQPRSQIRLRWLSWRFWAHTLRYEGSCGFKCVTGFSRRPGTQFRKCRKAIPAEVGRCGEVLRLRELKDVLSAEAAALSAERPPMADEDWDALGLGEAGCA